MTMSSVLSLQLLIAALVLGTLYALIALGLNLIYGTMRLLNVAHGEVVMLGGYIAYGMATQFGLNTAYALIPSMLCAALLGLAAYEFVFRPLLKKEQLLARVEANSLIIFFGVAIALQNIAALAFTASPKSYRYLDRVVTIGHASIAEYRLFALGVAGAACIGCMLFFRFSRTGLAIRALLQQRAAAALVGIEADRINRVVFALGFAMAGLAGCLVSLSEPISPFGGFPFTISALVVIILGGLGNLLGSLLGGLILGAVEVYGVALTSSNWRSIIVYSVFVVMLLWRPQGLFSRGAA
ncbi:MAG TPA: branched-chain amino acid ABC transporter permease [Xanthobacteraceae bacterium]|jgi:branched-chain amino acid transport system permease protein|nr:branched-chain amino acid ABC transporter permease [Xanthobacteraceae bacterium]